MRIKELEFVDNLRIVIGDIIVMRRYGDNITLGDDIPESIKLLEDIIYALRATHETNELFSERAS